ncbi:MAG: hypothetical protein WC004_04330 [Candidatus Absconditabacterales bacterium]
MSKKLNTPSFGGTLDGVSSLTTSLQCLGKPFATQLLSLLHNGCDRFPTKAGSYDFERFQKLNPSHQALLVDALVLEKAAYDENTAHAMFEKFYLPLFSGQQTNVQHALDQINARIPHLLEVIAKKGK